MKQIEKKKKLQSFVHTLRLPYFTPNIRKVSIDLISERKHIVINTICKSKRWKKKKRKKESKLYKWHRDAVVLNHFSPFNHSLCPVFDVFPLFLLHFVVGLLFAIISLGFLLYHLFELCTDNSSFAHVLLKATANSAHIQHNDRKAHCVHCAYAFLQIFFFAVVVVVQSSCVVYLFNVNIFPTVIIKIAKYDISRIDEKVILNPF